MMVLLDLTRSYESMRRRMEASEKKRCVSPRLAEGHLGGVRATGVPAGACGA